MRRSGERNVRTGNDHRQPRLATKLLPAVAALLLLAAGCGGGAGTGTDQPDSTVVAETTKQPLFTLLDARETGINFENRLEESVLTDQNVLSWQYFYNGAGVSIGDINNDGLEDVFFTCNSHPNALYLNKGNLQFENITAKSGISGNRWSTGSSMVA